MGGLRFLCFVGVFLCHHNFYRFWYGAYGVPTFFVMSGFLITRVLIQGEPLGLRRALYCFYARRGLQVFPVYYLVLFIVAWSRGLRYGPWYLTYTLNIKV